MHFSNLIFSKESFKWCIERLCTAKLQEIYLHAIYSNFSFCIVRQSATSDRNLRVIISSSSRSLRNYILDKCHLSINSYYVATSTLAETIFHDGTWASSIFFDAQSQEVSEFFFNYYAFSSRDVFFRITAASPFLYGTYMPNYFSAVKRICKITQEYVAAKEIYVEKINECFTSEIMGFITVAKLLSSINAMIESTQFLSFKAKNSPKIDSLHYLTVELEATSLKHFSLTENQKPIRKILCFYENETWSFIVELENEM